MSAHTEEVEITAKERLEKLTELRRRRYELSEKPLDNDTFYEWVELQAAYSTAGFENNAAAIGRRIGETQ